MNHFGGLQQTDTYPEKKPEELIGFWMDQTADWI